MKYAKALAAVAAGLVVAVPALAAAAQDDNLSLQEWLTVLGLFLPAVFVAFAPANDLPDKELINQVAKSPRSEQILERLQPLYKGTVETKDRLKPFENFDR